MGYCDFFYRKLGRVKNDVVLIPMCQYGVYRNDMFDINEEPVDLTEDYPRHCPFSNCPHVGDAITIDEATLLEFYCEDCDGEFTPVIKEECKCHDEGRWIVPRLMSRARKEFRQLCLRLLRRA